MLNSLTTAFARAPQKAATPKFQGDIHKRYPKLEPRDQFALERRYAQEDREMNAFHRKISEARHGENPIETEAGLHQEYITFLETLPEAVGGYRHLLWATRDAAKFHLEQKNWEKAESLLERALAIKIREDIEPRFHPILNAPLKSSMDFIGEQVQERLHSKNWQPQLPVPKSDLFKPHQTHHGDIFDTAELMESLAQTKVGLGKPDEAETLLQRKFLLLQKTLGYFDAENFHWTLFSLFELTDLAAAQNRPQDQATYARLVSFNLALQTRFHPYTLYTLPREQAKKLIPLADDVLRHEGDTSFARNLATTLYTPAKDYYKKCVSHGILDALPSLALALGKLAELTDDSVRRQGYLNLAERYTQVAAQLGVQKLENSMQPISVSASDSMSNPQEAQAQLQHWRGVLTKETDPDKKDLWERTIRHYERVAESFEKKALSDAIEALPDVVVTIHPSGYMQVTVVQ